MEFPRMATGLRGHSRSGARGALLKNNEILALVVSLAG
jgi:hypothetical protein